MSRVERERAFIIQNGAAEIFLPKISIAQVVKKIGGVLSRAHQLFIIRDRCFEICGRVFLVCFRKLRDWLCHQNRSAEEKRATECDHRFHVRKLSSNRRTSSRSSGEI